jgi:DNA-binding transcriptional MerR regulator
VRRRKKPQRRGYVRPSRAKPKVGWSVHELAQLTGVTVRTIREYLKTGVLPRSPFKGAATRYQRPQLLCLLAIRRLRATRRMPLPEIRKRVRAYSPRELEAFATADLADGPLAAALGLAVPSQQRQAASRKRNTIDLPARWARIELALGLELHIRDDASPRVLALAAQLRELCEAGKPS